MDFLTFKSFISIKALITFYYLGAIVLPLITWFLFNKFVLKYKLLNELKDNVQKIFWKSLTGKQKVKIISFFIVVIMFMELFWRMFFEFLIAYLQIRDAVLQSFL